MHAISSLAGITRTRLVSRVVSVLHGLRHRRARVQIAVATLSGNSLRQTVHTNRASVHQAAKLVIALLRVAGVTAGLAESNGSLSPGFMIHITCRLTAKNRDQLRNPTLGNRVWATFTFFSFYHWLPIRECVKFEVACLVRQSLSGQAPLYLADDCRLVSDSTRRPALS